ncbi:acetyl/propionyl-CoA carboxylase alpha subunit [Kribbella amoyensis]|uniref:biotin carboxylase n=1 Tax=Kribbella amoyensis TaxID=996641 RepID=A0A561B2K3_9ACTN|nr:carboxyl transferase domain-containing protein [Kribbella amoyensis]TWD73096.1 acetyl/propionyl-CoA carboxylase alpha subunit [Kribbella amoyensis]
MFSRIAIINRGESAMRLIHAVRDLNAQAGPGGHRIETVALHTEGERRAMFVREADLAYDLGPAVNRPYLDYAVLEKALVETKADAAWVGWGFVAEDPNFAELCARIGVTFIGPSPEAMRKLGDKIGSKLIAEEVGVPVAPWSRGGVDTLEDAKAAAARIGYPLMLKATAGGGGRGIRMVASDADLTDAYERTRDEAERAFGSGVVFLERLVTGARHVEVQVIADGQGTAWAIGVRDCSVQRRNQKVVEESASPVLGKDQAEELKASAERLAIAVGYAGAGTVEFLYHPGEQFFAFLEVNTRLQVEHPITEVTTDTDLVKLQIHVAAGGRLEGDKPVEVGHAVEARLNAEDPDRDFAPSPGRIALLDLPSGPGIRVDTGVGEGDSIPSEFDSMIAKIIAFGRDREEALARLRRAMTETTVVIEGGATNKSFVLDLLDAPEVIDGSADTGWIDRVRGEGRLIAHRHSGVALVAAGIEAYETEEAVERTRLIETARGGRPQVQHRTGRAVDLKLRGTAFKVTVFRIGSHRFRVLIADGATEQTVDAELDRIDRYKSRIAIGGRTHRLVTATHGTVQLVEVDGVTHRVSLDEGGVLRSPAPALVVATPTAVGDEVAAGSPVLVLESMKMETVLPAPFAARVKELLVSVGSQVETGAPLVRLEPVGDGAEEAVTEKESVDLDLPNGGSLPRDLVAREERRRGDLAAMLLGYDVDPRDDGRTLTAYLDEREDLVAEGVPPLQAELALLETFADFAELSRNRPAGEDLHLENRVHSPREHFHTYLQSFDPERGALPEDFRAKLSRVLRHYGVTDLDRTAELEQAVFRVFLAQQRSEPEVQLVTALLQRWITEPAPEPPLDGEARDVLDRLVTATQLRYPVIGDLARSVRFRWFDQPLVDAERESVLGGVRDELIAIGGLPDGAARDARIDALAAIPEQIVKFLAERIEGDELPDREPMLAVLIKRHYREHALRALREETVDRRPFAVADYTLDDRPTHLVSTIGRVDELTEDSRLVRSITAQLATAPEGHQGVTDLYLSWPGVPDSADEAATLLADKLVGLGFAHEVRRVAVAVCPDGDRPVGYFTFRPQPDGTLIEDALVRGVHPMVGRRLNLWRLREFDVTRLDAPEDVLLYRCIAKGNEADQRLVALAQIRQLAVVRDENGRVVGLPHAERAIANCLEAIRRARAASGAAGARLDLNYVWVHIWPAIEADVDQLTALKTKIAPVTAGAGIEEVLVAGTIRYPRGTEVQRTARFHYQPGSGVVTSLVGPTTEHLKPLDDYTQKVVTARRRGVAYPYELQALIAGRGGTATEYDLDDTGKLVPVDRPYGLNKAGIIAGVISTPTERHPEGVKRVVLCGDPLRALGAVSEAECSRIIAALDLAESMGVPVEWFAVSAGARISMDSGTENMDWVARALKRIVEFTQAGGEINIVVAGINVGAQPYWNAEATMLMHTKGILVMTPDSAMVLTGKQSLDFSGGVSAEDNFGIGGYDRVMGPNGQSQYWAPDLAAALGILMTHYDHTYVAAGETGPRRAPTDDPHDRDVTEYPHAPADSGFTTVGDIFSAATNPDRKKAFDIRTVMSAVSDQDHATLERWAGMADAETSVVYDAHLGGIPVTLIGIESKSVTRRGFPPTDGPDVYTAGTLFPRSSKKTARAINAASGNRPVVVIANLSGFDGSPESMRSLQLEYGAEIGRAIVNFDGPIVFCVVSRYHGGAFVVFSKALNPRMTVLAVEGSFASVIGGAPAAAVVFTREVDARTAKDPRVSSLEHQLAEASEAERASLATELAEIRRDVRSEKLGEVAAEFDRVHNIHRAVEVGSVDEVIAGSDLRPKIIAALEKGLGLN